MTKQQVTVKFRGGKEIGCEVVQQATGKGHHLVDREHNADTILRVSRGEEVPKGESWKVVRR